MNYSPVMIIICTLTCIITILNDEQFKLREELYIITKQEQQEDEKYRKIYQP